MRKIQHWLECYTDSESLDLLKDLALSHALKGGAQGARIADLIKRSNFRALCEMDVDYSSKHTVSEFAHIRQALAFFSKLEPLEIGIDKESVAVEKFRTTELLCRETNETFRAWASGGFSFPPDVDAVLFAAQRKIAHVLGDVPSLEKLRYRFGPGATTLTKKCDASSRRKLHDGIACSEDLVLMAPKLLAEMPSWTDLLDKTPGKVSEEERWASSAPSISVDDMDLSGHTDEEIHQLRCQEAKDRLDRFHSSFVPTAQVDIQIMDGVLAFVAKNAKTYRAIVTEPPLNGVYQLALGDYIAKRLARFGVDLSDQAPNQCLAKEGSLTGDLATLDLSSASDTIAIELVYHLLPVDWALALSAGRSSVITYRGERIVLEKFSSMGNGYTFALESLIFWALASSCGSNDDTVSVYGDDIIVATHNVALLTKVLTSCGFILNKEKSFSTGPFRESCGADYYRGFDIRPYYQKNWISPADLFKLHNFYVRHGDDERAKNVLQHIAPNLRLFGPDRYGDGHLLGDFPRERKMRHIKFGYSGYVFDTYKQLGIREKSRPMPGDYVFALYTIYQRSAERIGAVSGETLGTHDYAATLRARNYLEFGSIVGDPIPTHVNEDGEVVKAASLPGTDGYKRISIYTLGA